MNRPSARAAIAGLVILILGLSAGGVANAAGGRAMGVDPQAVAEGVTETRTLIVGSDVFIGDRIVTGPQGQVQILFDDKTELVVGANSALVLEDYLLRGDSSAGKLAINALSGTFRFVTGESQKDRYSIRTPNGTIGIRGTALDFIVNAIVGTRVLVYHGTVILCNLLNVCVTLDGQCEVGQYDLTDAAVLGPTDELDDDIREILRDQFEWSENQQPLLREFWVANARDCLNRRVEFSVPTSSSGTTSGPEITLPPPAIDEVDEDDGCDDDEIKVEVGGGD